MISVRLGGVTYSGITLQLAKVSATLTLNADSSASLIAVGQSYSGNWVQKDANTLTITMQNGPGDVAIVGSTLQTTVPTDWGDALITLAKQ